MFNFDYSKLFMMKLGIGVPDYKTGVSIIHNDCESILDKIKKIDTITLGVQKILYLVGWQYLGHDDKYPAFFEVNNQIKRDSDSSALESLLWLIAEGKKYNTTVSLHINFSDVYNDSPLWESYIKNDLIIKNCLGKPKVTGRWNGQKAYQVRFLREFELGFFQARFDKLCELIPLKTLGSVHVDAFFARQGCNTSIKDEQLGRRKMIEYCMDKGVDITSEFIYREQKSGNRIHRGKSEIIDLIPAYWHTAVDRHDVIKYQSNQIAGKINRGIAFDKSMEWLIYGNLQAEDIVNDNNIDWENKLLCRFATYGLPYLYLNQFSRVKITGYMKGRTMHYSENVITRIKDKQIIKDGRVLKRENELCLKVPYLCNTYLAFSATGKQAVWYIDNGDYKIYEQKSQGRELIQDITITNEELIYTPKQNIVYVIEKTG